MHKIFWACTLLASTAAAAPLDIAVSNDDGWHASGVQALYDALARAGHHVVLAAPADNQSGSGAAINFEPLRVTRQADNQFSVEACRDAACTLRDPAKPATSALIAIDIARERRHGRAPDLLLSGINAGANLGKAVVSSGTVGNALVALNRPIGGEIPGIALSTDEPASCRGEAGCIRRHYDSVAEFAVRLVGWLAAGAARRHEARLLPRGIALNVNYPAQKPKGLRWTVAGESSPFSGKAQRIDFSCALCKDLAVGATTAAGMRGMHDDTARDLHDSDSSWFVKGYITITPLEPGIVDAKAQRLKWVADRRLMPVD
jgi:5'-nucleotidase